jgi:hypothetical protein
MPKVIGLLCCLVSLAASVLAKSEPASAAVRAGLAFIAGRFLTQIWYVFFATQMAKPTSLSDEERNAA